jgi:site-specific DNA recombinase
VGECVSVTVIGYVRVSTQEQSEEGVSLDAQREKIKAWAQLNDEPEPIVFKDAGISGSTISQRPGLQDALDAVCKRKGILVVYSLSRLARSTRDTLGISDRLAKAGAELVSLSEKIDTTSASGKMCFRLLAVLSEFERDQVAERTKSAMAHMRKTGRRISRFAPYGWDFDAAGEALVVNCAEQQVLQRIRMFRGQGMTLRQIAAELNDHDVPTKLGGEGGWSPKVVRSLLLRPKIA